uniref:Capsid protein n=1 Tax=Dromedary picobirnavirus TaxID=1574421 RepID=A0A0A1EKX2_9VIRU|nr:capsid protein [Dromedary picobirnavirus]
MNSSNNQDNKSNYQGKGHKDQSVPANRRNNGNRKGKGNFRGKDKTTQTQCASYDSVTTNDIAWWNKATELYDRATNIAFARQAGVPVPVTDLNGPEFGKLNANFDTAFNTGSRRTLPMGQLFEYVPTVGVSNSDNSAPNRAFQAMASAIYSKTTGALPFPQYVLGLMNIAVQSIAQNIALVKRALDTSYTYAYSNTALPRVLLATQGINPDTVLGVQNDVIFALDDLIRDFNALHFPSYMDAFKRHYSLARNVWWDAADPKAQFFIFRPACYYAYSDLGNVSSNGGEVTYDGIARCVAMPMPYRDANGDTTKTVDITALLDVIRKQIESLKNSDDYWTVRGAMGRVFSEGQFMTIDFYTPSTTGLTVDQNMLWQIANFDYAGNVQYGSRIFPKISLGDPAYDGLDIVGDPISNILISEPKLQTRKFQGSMLGVTSRPGDNMDLYSLTNAVSERHPLNSQANEPSKDFVMEATRLKCSGEIMDVDPMIDTGDWSTTKPYVAIRSCGTELIVESQLVYLEGMGDNPEAPGSAVIRHITWTPIMLINEAKLLIEGYAVQFPWNYVASTFYLRTAEIFQSKSNADEYDEPNSYVRVLAFGDVFNYTYLTNAMLNNFVFEGSSMQVI